MLKIDFWVSHDQGKRPTMEDEHFAGALKESGWFVGAVCDGHGGTEIVSRISKNECKCLPMLIKKLNEETKKYHKRFQTACSLKECILPIPLLKKIIIESIFLIDRGFYDEYKKKPHNAGSTLVLLMINVYSRQFAFATIGDSRCVWSVNSKIFSTSDHKPDLPSEKKRIEEAGFKVSKDNRVDGILAMSRALGDFSLKKNKTKNLSYDPITGPVSIVPDLFFGRLSLQDASQSVFILACDGVWDVLNASEAVEVVKKSLHQKKESDPAQDLVRLSLLKKTTDNVTAFVVKTSIV